MALLFYSQDDDPEAWRTQLERRVTGLDFRAWPAIGDPSTVDAALVWRPAPGMLRGLANLRVVLSLGAGVDALLADPMLPDVPLCRLVDPSLTRTMSEFVLLQVLKYHRRLDRFRAQQLTGSWRLELPRPPGETGVGVMGLGELGAAAAATLAAHGFKVAGWSRGPRALPGIACHSGTDGLAAFLMGADILVCLLPLTDATRGILGAPLFARLPRGARLVNVGRGAHLVEADLLQALAEGAIGHASLDVFVDEPLPQGHPFWTHQQIDVTPHAASYGIPDSAAEAVAENLRRLRDGRPLLHVVDRTRGY